MPGMREALEAAFDEHDEELNENNSSSAEETGSADAGAGAAELGAANDAALGTGAAEEGEPKSSGATKERDASGKFSKSTKGDVQDQKQVPPQGQSQVKKPEGEQLPQIKAPSSWRPAVREKYFTSLPREVQEEIGRRERETELALNNSAQARNYAQQVHQIMTPYDAMIQAEGGNHVTAIRNLMQTAYHLRTAPPQQKAQMVANMIMQHGVDFELLDNALQALVSGNGGQGAQARPNAQLQHAIQEALAPVNQFMQQMQRTAQQNQQTLHSQMQTDIEAFAADPKNKYFNDVRDIMADLFEAASKRGVGMTLQDAYTRATMAHPEIAQLVLADQASASAAQRSAAARRARNASASLASSEAPAGSGAGKTKPANLRSAIEAAWDETEQRAV